MFILFSAKDYSSALDSKLHAFDTIIITVEDILVVTTTRKRACFTKGNNNVLPPCNCAAFFTYLFYRQEPVDRVNEEDKKPTTCEESLPEENEGYLFILMGNHLKSLNYRIFLLHATLDKWVFCYMGSLSLVLAL